MISTVTCGISGKNIRTNPYVLSKATCATSGALLLVSGESNIGKLNGEVLLVKEKGTWRINDELADLELK